MKTGKFILVIFVNIGTLPNFWSKENYSDFVILVSLGTNPEKTVLSGYG